MFIFNAAIIVLVGIMGYGVQVLGGKGDGTVGGFVGLVIGALIVYVFKPRR